jgi:hypothetical protein
LIERQLGFVVAPAFTPDTEKYNLESNMETCDLASDSSQPASLAFSKGVKAREVDRTDGFLFDFDNRRRRRKILRVTCMPSLPPTGC